MINLFCKKFIRLGKRFNKLSNVDTPSAPSFGTLTLDIRNFVSCNYLFSPNTVEVYRADNSLVGSISFDANEVAIKTLIIEFSDNEVLYIYNNSPYFTGYLCEANDMFLIEPENSVTFENANSDIGPPMVKVNLPTIQNVHLNISLAATVM